MGSQDLSSRINRLQALAAPFLAAPGWAWAARIDRNGGMGAQIPELNRGIRL
jgi:hypothetical protein